MRWRQLADAVHAAVFRAVLGSSRATLCQRQAAVEMAGEDDKKKKTAHACSRGSSHVPFLLLQAPRLVTNVPAGLPPPVPADARPAAKTRPMSVRGGTTTGRRAVSYCRTASVAPAQGTRRGFLFCSLVFLCSRAKVPAAPWPHCRGTSHHVSVAACSWAEGGRRATTKETGMQPQTTASQVQSQVQAACSFLVLHPSSHRGVVRVRVSASPHAPINGPARHNRFSSRDSPTFVVFLRN